MDVPVLETDRLVLRAFRQDDFELYCDLAADPEVTRHLGGPVDRPAAWRQMAMHAGHWTLRGHGNWAVADRSGAFVGRVGFWHPDGWPGTEIGWALRRAAWGRGYATEAAAAALEWGWAHCLGDEVLSLVHPDNDGSLRVAEKLGMTVSARTEVGGEPVLVHRLGRPA